MQTIIANINNSSKLEVFYQDEVQLDINIALTYIKSGQSEIADYIENIGKPELNNYISNYAKPIVSEVIDNIATPMVDEYLNSTAKPNIDEYVANHQANFSNEASQITSDFSAMADSKISQVQEAADVASSQASIAGNHANLAQSASQSASNSAQQAIDAAATSDINKASASESANLAAKYLADMQPQNFINKTDDESINGIKTFLASPLVPTADTNSNNTLVANTSWVNTFCKVSNKTVVATYRNGNSWYRKWSDGWIEQGGTGPTGKGTHTITFPTAFSTTTYTFIAQAMGSKFGDYYSCITNRSTTSMTLSVGSEFASGFIYYSCGF